MVKNLQRQKSIKDKWQTFSLTKQFANIGSEFSRAFLWKSKHDRPNTEKSFWRLLDLIDLTVKDKRWQSRLFEILRLREVLCDYFLGLGFYKILPEKLKAYFLQFGLANIRARSSAG